MPNESIHVFALSLFLAGLFLMLQKGSLLRLSGFWLIVASLSLLLPRLSRLLADIVFPLAFFATVVVLAVIYVTRQLKKRLSAGENRTQQD